MRWLTLSACVFGVVILACQTPAILSPPNTDDNDSCLLTEHPCYDGSRKTGCCPLTDACSGPFPNVGCGEELGYCCPTQSGAVGAGRTRQTTLKHGPQR